MIVIPAVDLLGGACVQLQGGDPRATKVRLPDPVAEARRFVEAGAEWLHVVDLDRALGLGSNLRIVQRIVESVPARVQVGGGVRQHDDADALLRAGAARVVCGTRAVTDPVFLEQAARRLGDRLVVAVDAKGRDVVVKGWTEGTGRDLVEFGKEASALGVGALLYTDVGREGRLEGSNVETVAELARSVDVPVIASGGVATIDDLRALAEAGAWGAVVGMAAYTGRIDMKAAMREMGASPWRR